MAIRMGVIGAGVWGLEHHAQMIHDLAGFELKAVCDVLPERREAAARQFGVATYPTADRMYRAEDIDAVVVVVPPRLARDVVLESLDAGKAVIVEKPFGQSVQDADAMMERAAKTGRLLTVHHNRRWDCGFQTVRHARAKGLLGEVFVIEARMHGFGHYEGATPWRKEKGCGMLIDWGPHMVDWMLCLAGSEVKEVFCVTQTRLWNKASEDYMKILMTFRSGLVAQVEATESARRALPLWFVMGTKGTLTSDDSGTVAVGATISTEIAGEPATVKPQVFPKNWAAFYENFRAAFTGAEPIAVTPAQARDVMRILDAARESERIGRSVSL